MRFKYVPLFPFILVSSNDMVLRDFFVKPFPNLSYRPFAPFHGWIRYDNKTKENSLLRRTHIRDLYRSKVEYLYMCYDLTSYVSPSLYQEALFDNGLVGKKSRYTTSVHLGKELRCSLFPLLFNPTPSLCTLINSYIQSMEEYYIIGAQLRFGGSLANLHEKQFMGRAGLQMASNLIESEISRVGDRKIALFISTDSSAILKELSAKFKEKVSVVTVKEFQIGHSCKALYKKKKGARWDSFVKRAIVDLMVLKESDYLIVTHRSSFGEYAAELQECSHRMLSPSFYSSLLNLTCSVFHHRNSSYHLTVISRVLWKQVLNDTSLVEVLLLVQNARLRTLERSHLAHTREGEHHALHRSLDQTQRNLGLRRRQSPHLTEAITINAVARIVPLYPTVTALHLELWINANPSPSPTCFP